MPSREARRQHREPPRRQALRLERRGGHRPPAGGDPLLQACKAMAWSSAKGELARKRDILEHHVLVQRGVAEQHVEELPGIVADRLAGERDADLELPFPPLDDLIDPADDAREHEFIVDRRQRHFDACSTATARGRAPRSSGHRSGHGRGLAGGRSPKHATRRTAPSCALAHLTTRSPSARRRGSRSIASTAIASADGGEAYQESTWRAPPG